MQQAIRGKAEPKRPFCASDRESVSPFDSSAFFLPRGFSSSTFGFEHAQYKAALCLPGRNRDTTPGDGDGLLRTSDRCMTRLLAEAYTRPRENRSGKRVLLHININTIYRAGTQRPRDDAGVAGPYSLLHTLRKNTPFWTVLRGDAISPTRTAIDGSFQS
ncbi:translation elongation factor P-lysine lysyltransferase [Anopheles sinensis]|uniref:Translation elongation factor P-lysine lysyltransferase n=1 Tax=Anopheles sinensis TaxID=74873 RepID=A0A084VPU1_ANOSI|nr:translation elongation factor P-lysine lysyltransferase [Anopheles sinensis]